MNNGYRWCLASLLLASVVGVIGCAGANNRWDEATTFVYRCSDEEGPIVVTIKADRGHLFAPGVSEPIKREEGNAAYVGSDVSYLADQPPDLAPGQTAQITIAGRQLTDCRNDPRAAVWEGAKLRGVSYRAIGQEPAWSLEIDREHGFRLVTDYANSERRFAYAEPVYDAARRSARYTSEANGETLAITISGERCRDSMSGEEFDSRVEIEWRDRVLKGCGRALH